MEFVFKISLSVSSLLVCRNVINFCAWKSYLVISMNSFSLFCWVFDDSLVVSSCGTILVMNQVHEAETGKLKGEKDILIILCGHFNTYISV